MNNEKVAVSESLPDAKQYMRRIWVTVILSLLDPVLPFFYNGYLRRGVIVFFVLIIAYFLLLLLPVISFTGFMIFLVTLAVLYLGMLAYNVRQTLKANRIGRPRIKRVWVRIVTFFVLGLILGMYADLMIERFVVESYRIPAASMENALLAGDNLMAVKKINTRSLHKNDLIIFRYPGDLKQNYVKRVIALAGDRIRIENKQVFINDFPEQMLPTVTHIDTAHCYPADDRGYLVSGDGGQSICMNTGNRDNMPEKTVPPGMLFVMGDNRDNSADSRYWGFLDQNLIVGRPKYIYFSWDPDNNRIRWERIGKKLD